MYIVSAVLLVVFAVIGIVSLASQISLYLMRYRKGNSIMLITPIKGKCEDAEMLLRSSAAKIKWISRGRHDCVICLDCNMDEETRKICENVCKEYGFTQLVNKNELFSLIEQS